MSQSIDYPGRRRAVKQQIVAITLNGTRGERYCPCTASEHSYRHSRINKIPQWQCVNLLLLSQMQPEQVEVVVEQADAPPGVEETQLTRMWSDVEKKTRWLWHAIDQRTKQVLAYVFGAP